MRGTVKDEEGGSGVKSVKVNGVAATVDTAKGTWELTAAALTDGVNNLKLVVEDVAGNVNEDAAQVAVSKGILHRLSLPMVEWILWGRRQWLGIIWMGAIERLLWMLMEVHLP